MRKWFARRVRWDFQFFFSRYVLTNFFWSVTLKFEVWVIFAFRFSQIPLKIRRLILTSWLFVAKWLARRWSLGFFKFYLLSRFNDFFLRHFDLVCLQWCSVLRTSRRFWIFLGKVGGTSADQLSKHHSVSTQQFAFQISKVLFRQTIKTNVAKIWDEICMR